MLVHELHLYMLQLMKNIDEDRYLPSLIFNADNSGFFFEKNTSEPFIT